MPLTTLRHAAAVMYVQMYVCTNGRNHWILRQPDQISKKTETMARGIEVLFVATSDRLPSHPTKIEETAVCGSYILSLLDDWGGDHWLL